MSYRIGFITCNVVALLAALGVQCTAQAAIYTVGTPSGVGQPCTHGTIQAAIDAANNSPGADTIRLTRSLTYQPEANTINTAQELTIEGGYATCTQTTPDTTHTVISGAGGAAAPVFTITAPTGALIRMRRLEISGGDVAGDGHGGGIRFSGVGMLEISHSTITSNMAGYGGGISASGAGGIGLLQIGEKVVIAGNVARHGGGGIYAHEMLMYMVEPDSFLINNEATGVSGNAGFGGGLYLHANHRDTIAYIGTTGAIMNNRARHGGGVALAGYNDDMGTTRNIVLHLFSTDAAKRGAIRSNTAWVSGGGIYAEGDEGAFDGDMDAYVYLWNAILADNAAPDGGAVRLGGDGWAWFHFNSGGAVGWPAGALPCTPALGECGRIEGNTTWNGSTYTQGAILRGTADGPYFEIGQRGGWSGAPLPKGGILIQGNKGGRLIDDADSDSGWKTFNNALIVSNEFSQQLLRGTNGRVELIDTTLADNLIGAAHVLSTGSSYLQIHRSLLWQPGKTLLNRSGGTLDSEHNLVNEIASFGGNFNGALVIGSPRFVDPVRGDFGLRAGSPAIDRAPAIPGDDRDLLGNPRDRDLPYKWNYNGDPNGVRDIGAIERQHLQPLVLNGDFNLDLRLWDVVTANTTTRDATQNASGGANSGSAHIQRTNPAPFQVTQGISHCIHLPGPAVYALNGWGRGTGTQLVAGDSAVLRWEFRLNGSETCTGTPDATGFHSLSNTPNWNRPAQPAHIDLSGYSMAQWAGNASIRVILEAHEFGAGGTASTNAWFDGITLDIVPQGPELFADGFEGCPPARGEACR